MPLDETSLFLYDPRRDLDTLLEEAWTNKASRLLILSGKSIVCRVSGKLSAPMHPDRIHFRQTQSLAEAILTEDQQAELEKSGAVEIDYQPTHGSASHQHFRVNVFYGDGAHNVVVFLTPER